MSNDDRAGRDAATGKNSNAAGPYWAQALSLLLRYAETEARQRHLYRLGELLSEAHQELQRQVSLDRKSRAN